MANLLDRHEWDYVIGSVHFLGEHAVDIDDETDVWRHESSAERVWQRYFEAVAQSALTGMYDIIAHPDLVKIWGSGAARAVEGPALLLRAGDRGDARRRRGDGGLDRRAAQARRRDLPRAARCSRWRSTRACRSRCPPTRTRRSTSRFGYEQALELLDDCGVHRARGLRGARAADGAARVRTGLGIDTHRFADGRPLILGGVEIPHTHGLTGHSDADVLAHAITDAILGAASMGDIGTHFPDTDPEVQGRRLDRAAARDRPARGGGGLARRARRRHGDDGAARSSPRTARRSWRG